MKKIWMIVLVIFLCMPGQSQILIAILFGDKLNNGKMEFGIGVTPSWTGISNIESKRRSGLDLGIYFNIRPDKKFFLHVEGIAKGSLGAKEIVPYSTGNDTLDNLFTGGTVERKIKSFGLPILGRYTITKKFFADAGIQANMMLGVKDIFHVKVNEQNLNYTIKNKDLVTLLDFGVAGGLFYKFNDDKRSMGIGIRYYQGLTDIHKTITGTQVNSAWQLTISIPVGAGKAQAKAANAAGQTK